MEGVTAIIKNVKNRNFQDTQALGKFLRYKKCTTIKFQQEFLKFREFPKCLAVSGKFPKSLGILGNFPNA